MSRLDEARAEHRREMGTRMDKVADALLELLNYWQGNDLPGDFLSGEEYPFDTSLDDLQAQVRHAARSIVTVETVTFWMGRRRITAEVVRSEKDASGSRFVTVVVDGEEITKPAIAVGFIPPLEDA